MIAVTKLRIEKGNSVVAGLVASSSGSSGAQHGGLAVGRRKAAGVAAGDISSNAHDSYGACLGLL